MTSIAPSSTWRTPRLVTIALTAAALALSYAGVVSELVRVWSRDPLYSYGFAVPLISGYLVAARSPVVRSAPSSPDYVWGSLAVLAAAMMFVAGEFGTAVRLQELSLVVMIAGAVLLLFGRSMFRRVWFAIAYLLLMVPVWTDLIGRLQVPSQLVSGRIATAVFHLFGMPAVQEGTLIYLPRITLEVLRECSGVNQLVAVFAITLPAAYLWVSGVRRVLFVLVSLLIAYLSNGARIALIGVLAQNGFDTSSPRIHLLEGLLVAMLGYGLIALLFSCVARRGWHASADESLAAADPGREEPGFSGRRIAIDVALVIGIVLPVSVTWLSPHTAVAPAGDLHMLPYVIGAWSRTGNWQPSGEPATFADDEVRLEYRRQSGERVRLYIGYLRYQRAGRGLAHALPELPRGVESVMGVNLRSLERVNFVEQSSPGATRGVFYWYDVDGRGLADSLAAKRRVLWNAVTRGRTNGAVIMIEWSGTAEDAGRSRERALEFLRALLPILPNYLPALA